MTVFFSDRFGLEKVILDKANKHEIAERLVECLVQAGA